MDEASLKDWVDRYVEAWNSNDPDDIRGLFTEGADYLTEPYSAAWNGRDDIVRKWLENKDDPGDTEFSYEVLAIQDDLGLVKGKTIYKARPREYVNLWEITLAPDGRATRFVEWWMKIPQES